MRIKSFVGAFYLVSAKKPGFITRQNMLEPIFNRDQMRLSKRAGNKKIDLMSDNTPSTAMPSKRNGSNSSHTIGYNTMARMASGAQSTSNINHAKNVSIH